MKYFSGIKGKLKYCIYVLVIIPFITEYLEDRLSGYLLEQWITEIVISIFIAVVVFMIIEQYNSLERLSLTDALTGISNRRQFELDLRREMQRSQRLNTRIVLIFFDLDGFKKINDTFGHRTGDMVLIKFAESLSLFIRKGVDFCYRFGGDEFAVLLTSISREEVDNIEARIEHKFSDILSDKLPDGVSASKGIVISRENESFHELLSRADKAMYDEKKNRTR